MDFVRCGEEVGFGSIPVSARSVGSVLLPGGNGKLWGLEWGGKGLAGIRLKGRLGPPKVAEKRGLIEWQKGHAR